MVARLTASKSRTAHHGSDVIRFWRALKAGQVRIGILKLLKESDLHGYGIMEKIRDRTGGLFSPTAGTVYPILQDLLKRGHVESRWVPSGGRRKKRVYHITEKGSSTLAALDRLRREGEQQMKDSLFKASKLLELDDGEPLLRSKSAAGVAPFFGLGPFGGHFDRMFNAKPRSEKLKILKEAQKGLRIRIRSLKQREKSISQQIQMLQKGIVID